MPMHIDQPGHQRASIARDSPGVSAIGCNRIAGDFFDPVPADENVHACAQRVVLAIENTNILKEDVGGWLSGSGLTSRTTKAPAPDETITSTLSLMNSSAISR